MLQAVSVPGSVAEAQAMLQRSERAAIIAGGTALMPLLNYGTDISTLVSLRRAGLSGVSIKAGKAVIGAAATLAELEAEQGLSFLHQALYAIASPTIRNMATVGGNLFVKQPYGDLAVCLVALGATAGVAGPDGERQEPVEEIVRTGVKPGEIVTSVSLALPPTGTFHFRKAGRKALNSAAIVTVAAIVHLDDGLVGDCRIGLGGVARHPLRALAAEMALNGQPFDRDHVEAAALAALADIDPFDDAYASAWHRARVTPIHVRRALLNE
ncbi:FAD binding domain-containing protein [Mesorhizobium sp. L-8-10]|uniref:FAD binding domain-containing protein n=1 Tax=Mesorhizobium sp. L-8-10 TaxID=2744523 RepID=UPI001926057D|nr:FAD binding domain-containing protein [Mesorhizobium sp. L-8-10]